MAGECAADASQTAYDVLNEINRLTIELVDHRRRRQRQSRTNIARLQRSVSSKPFEQRGTAVDTVINHSFSRFTVTNERICAFIRSPLSDHHRLRSFRFYDELDYERRVRKRRTKLLSSCEDAFTHVRKYLSEKSSSHVPMDAREAAQVRWSTSEPF